MKKISCLIVVFICLFLTSCQKEVKQFVGDYSFKISGNVSIIDSLGNTSTHLVSKIGQINILKNDGDESNNVVITVNEMAGSAYTFYANVVGDSIFINPYQFSTTIIDNETDDKIFTITSEGSGILHDDVLIINEKWTGNNPEGNAELLGNEMVIIAERN